MQKRVVITGTFCSLNKGDAAMRIALVDELRDALPGCHLTVTTPYPELDKNAYRSHETVKCSRRDAKKVASMLFRAICWNAAYRTLGKDFSGLLNDELKMYRNSDVVVDVSGDGITEEYGKKCIYAHLVPVIFAELLAKPVFVCAQTIGPITQTGWLTHRVLRKADKTTAREEITMSYLSKLGLRPGALSLTADMAFLMKASPKSRGLEILQREGVSTDKPKVGFSISRLPGHILGSEPGAEPVSLEMHFAETLNRLVDMGIQPVFISHTTGPGERRDDRVAAKRVASLTKYPDKIAVLKGDYSAEETKAVLGLMDLFVGVRMHSCIGAMSMGVPTISVAYGPKAYGIMKLAEQERWLTDIRHISADKLFGLIQTAWDARETTRKSLEVAMPKVFEMARENVGIIKQMLHMDSSVPVSSR